MADAELAAAAAESEPLGAEMESAPAIAAAAAAAAVGLLPSSLGSYPLLRLPRCLMLGASSDSLTSGSAGSLGLGTLLEETGLSGMGREGRPEAGVVESEDGFSGSFGTGRGLPHPLAVSCFGPLPSSKYKYYF